MSFRSPIQNRNKSPDLAWFPKSKRSPMRAGGWARMGTNGVPNMSRTLVLKPYGLEGCRRLYLNLQLAGHLRDLEEKRKKRIREKKRRKHTFARGFWRKSRLISSTLAVESDFECFLIF